MKCDVVNKPNGWSDFKILDPYSQPIEHCRQNGFKLEIALDLGCKGGTIGDILIRNFSPKKVYGFEPTPESYDEVKQRYAKDHRVEVFKLAVSNQNGTADFYIRADKPSGNSLRYGKDRPTMQVETIRLDTWAQAHNIPSFDVVKIDVEGHELEALEGMGDYLNTVNILMAEVRFNDRPTLYHEAAAFLERYGLQLYSIMGLYYENGRISWGDVVFVRNGAKK